MREFVGDFCHHFGQVLVRTFRWIKREPWIITPPGLVLWYWTHNEDERRAYIDRVTRP